MAFGDVGPETIPLRDFFAGCVMCGLVANTDRDATVEVDAEVAYRQADAMLAERKEGK